MNFTLRCLHEGGPFATSILVRGSEWELQQLTERLEKAPAWHGIEIRYGKNLNSIQYTFINSMTERKPIHIQVKYAATIILL